MHYAITPKHIIKDGQNRFYSIVQIVFSEEELAIIRVRNMGPYFLLFANGTVNHPEAAGVMFEPSALIFLIGLIAIAGLFAANISLIFIIVILCALWWLIDNEIATYEANKGAFKQTVTLERIMSDGHFTVCAFDTQFQDEKVRREIGEQMERLKALLKLGADERGTTWSQL